MHNGCERAAQTDTQFKRRIETKKEYNVNVLNDFHFDFIYHVAVVPRQRIRKL